MLIKKCKYLYRSVCLEVFLKRKCCKHTSRKDKYLCSLFSYGLKYLFLYTSIAFKRGEMLRDF